MDDDEPEDDEPDDDDVMPKATLTASPSAIQSGQSSTLTWTTTGAVRVTLDGASVALSGSRTVSPAATKTYTLEAERESSSGSGSGKVTVQATVTVSTGTPPPAAKPTATLKATPATIDNGQSTTLEWTSADATTVTLDGASVAANGTRAVSPTATKTYTLAATNGAGTTTVSATVTVNAAPPPPTPMPSATLTASPNTIESGQSARLDWTSANATTVTLNGAAVPASGSQMVSPGASTTYTLRATNATGTTTATANVTVMAPPPPPMRITYVNDIQPILQQNCVQCHSGPNPTAGRDFSTYPGVMTVVTPGDPNSLLIRRTQPGGSMHGFLSPDPLGRAETIRRWVVDFMAAEQ